MTDLLSDERIIEIYDVMDKDKNGILDAEEFTESMNKIFPTIQEKTLKKLFRFANEKGEFTKEAFISLVRFVERKKEKSNPFVMLFEYCDENGNGVLEFDEFVKICTTIEENASMEIIKECFEKADLDKNNVIDFKEYMTAIAEITEKLAE